MRFHIGSVSPYVAAIAAASALAGVSLDWNGKSGPQLFSLVLPASCESQSVSTPAEVLNASRIQRFKAWLQRQGADVQCVDIRPCEARQDFGLFATKEAQQRCARGWKRAFTWMGLGRDDEAVLATFPLRMAIHRYSIASLDDVAGPILREMMGNDEIDDRAAVMLWLVVQRCRGEHSPWHSWIDLLPAAVHCPLSYSDDELHELRGTTLWSATMAQRQHVARLWRRLQPACSRILQQYSGAARQATFEDFVWSHSIFFSRAVSLPLPASLLQPEFSSSLSASSSSSSSSSSLSSSVSPALSTSSSPSSSPLHTSSPTSSTSPASSLHGTRGANIEPIVAVESLVPGLDFANHSNDANCWWTVRGGPKQKQQKPHVTEEQPSIKLVVKKRDAPRVDTEVFIDYGGKTNEELLFCCGFAVENNANDMLMVECPIGPPQTWDDVMQLRMQLLQLYGLKPQLFFPAIRSAVHATARHASDMVPDEVWQVIEAFVLNRNELQQRLQRAQHAQQRDEELPAWISLRAGGNEEGLELACASTLLRLLELKCRVMESDDEGTGSLEQDVKLLERGSDAFTPQHWFCIVYRATQKRLARAYLTYARAHLQHIMQRQASAGQ